MQMRCLRRRHIRCSAHISCAEILLFIIRTLSSIVSRILMVKWLNYVLLNVLFRKSPQCTIPTALFKLMFFLLVLKNKVPQSSPTLTWVTRPFSTINTCHAFHCQGQCGNLMLKISWKCANGILSEWKCSSLQGHCKPLKLFLNPDSIYFHISTTKFPH